MGSTDAILSTTPTMTATVRTAMGDVAPTSSFSALRLNEPLSG